MFAYIVDGSPEELQSALDITLRRFAEYHNLQGAFGRRAQTERAKGILMERHQIDEQQAFAMLRDHSRRTGRKLVDVAARSSTVTCCFLRDRPPGRRARRSDGAGAASPSTTAARSPRPRAPPSRRPGLIVPPRTSAR